jgi:hypothetical protein
LPLSTHGADNKEAGVEQNIIAAPSHRQLKTLDIFCRHRLVRMDIDVRVFVFVLLKRDFHLNLRRKVCNQRRLIR